MGLSTVQVAGQAGRLRQFGRKKLLGIRQARSRGRQMGTRGLSGRGESQRREFIQYDGESRHASGSSSISKML
jgi:hypothetical protein